MNWFNYTLSKLAPAPRLDSDRARARAFHAYVRSPAMFGRPLRPPFAHKDRKRAGLDDYWYLPLAVAPAGPGTGSSAAAAKPAPAVAAAAPDAASAPSVAPAAATAAGAAAAASAQPTAAVALQ